MSQNVRKNMSKSLMVAGLTGMLLFTSACGSEGGSNSAPSGKEASAEAKKDTVVVDGVEYGPTIDEMPTLKDLAKDENGEWRKTTILPDDPAFNYEASVVDPVTNTVWTDDEIKEAQRVTVEMAVDMIDTAANGAPNDLTSRVDWWEANKDKFDPAWQQDIYNALISDDPNMAVVFKGYHRVHDDSKLDYGLVYGEDEVHVKDREIKTSAITAGTLPDGRYSVMVTLELKYTNVAEVDGKKTDEKATSKLVFHVSEDTETGEMLITGLQPEYKFQILR